MIQTQNLRQIRVRIKSIENTRKITRAMEMVSASKLSRVKAPFSLIRPYLAELESMLCNLLSDSPGLKNALLEKREKIKNSALCVVTSDTGLCGTYNDNVIKCAEQFLGGIKDHNVSVIAVGKEGHNHFQKKGFRVTGSYPGLYGRYSPKTADVITGDLKTMFISGEADEVHVAYSRFRASLRHPPAVEKLFAVEFTAKPGSGHIFEPPAEAMLDSMILRYATCKMRAILMEAFTAEHSARMLAMKTATDNADDLIKQLTLARNKARQFAITKEVLEISASAEALKG